eukprot:TRINITY_DN4317_c0_g1_i1.p1 TRINITY_DN4317_c0_g1~~TRINITY_DN4317_c0_g1_i1.p1  ORF type:complete len:113 (+),score=1.25 TRINITY_DN4317_c0_g1_i1:13-351(+)
MAQSNHLPLDNPSLMRPKSSPAVFVTPSPSNGTLSHIGVRLYDGSNQLSPNHLNAVLLDPPSPSTLNLAQAITSEMMESSYSNNFHPINPMPPNPSFTVPAYYNNTTPTKSK